MRGGARTAGGGGAGAPAPSQPFPTSPQYFSDSAEAASWLLLRQKQLESASCGKDQAEAEALLQRHRLLERGVRAFRAELRELEDQARAAAAQVSLKVRWKRAWIPVSYTTCEAPAAPCPELIVHSSPPRPLPSPVSGHLEFCLCTPDKGIKDSWTWLGLPSIVQEHESSPKKLYFHDPSL